MNCKQCGTRYGGKVCPNCGVPAAPETPSVNAKSATQVVGQKKKEPFYKKWWFWLIIVLYALGVIGGFDEDDIMSTDNESGSSTIQESNDVSELDDESKIVVADFSVMSKDDIEAWALTNKVICKFSGEYSDTVASGAVISQSKNANEKVKEGTTIKVIISKGKKPSIEYQNALKKAESYSELMHMSKQAIYKQLTSEYGEGFSAAAAQYAIDSLEADYKANALAKAKAYQQTMSMSKSAIYDQLVSEYGEQFTAEEAQYAIEHLED